jgi:hypothetical protein
VDGLEEGQIVSLIEKVDVKELKELSEGLSDEAGREKFVDKLKDYCVDFLLDVLPTIKVPPISGVKEEVEYTIGNLDLSRFNVNKDDVKVELGKVGETGEIIRVELTNIKAILLKMNWQFAQQYFPYMNGDGTADADVSGGTCVLGFALKRVVLDEDGTPVASVADPAADAPKEGEAGKEGGEEDDEGAVLSVDGVATNGEDGKAAEAEGVEGNKTTR